MLKIAGIYQAARAPNVGKRAGEKRPARIAQRAATETGKNETRPRSGSDWRREPGQKAHNWNQVQTWISQFLALNYARTSDSEGNFQLSSRNLTEVERLVKENRGKFLSGDRDAFGATPCRHQLSLRSGPLIVPRRL